MTWHKMGAQQIPIDQEKTRERLGKTSLAGLVVGGWCGSVNVSEREYLKKKTERELRVILVIRDCWENRKDKGQQEISESGHPI